MAHRPSNRVAWCLLALAAALSLPACAAFSGRGDYYETQERVSEPQRHVAGQALIQTKQRMRRAQRDLIVFQASMESLRRHRSLQDIALFEAFVRTYIAEHVDPLLAQDNRSWHPELLTLDANLRFAKGAVLIEMRDRRRLDRLIRAIATRFDGMESMLVEYPIGTKSTLRDGIRELRRGRWQL
jgi:hypothetical protein